jgi:hypothetical protein
MKVYVHACTSTDVWRLERVIDASWCICIHKYRCICMHKCGCLSASESDWCKSMYTRAQVQCVRIHKYGWVYYHSAFVCMCLRVIHTNSRTHSTLALLVMFFIHAELHWCECKLLLQILYAQLHFENIQTCLFAVAVVLLCMHVRIDTHWCACVPLLRCSVWALASESMYICICKYRCMLKYGWCKSMYTHAQSMAVWALAWVIDAGQCICMHKYDVHAYTSIAEFILTVPLCACAYVWYTQIHAHTAHSTNT